MCFKKMRTDGRLKAMEEKAEGINRSPSHVSIVKFVYTHSPRMGRGRKGGSDREMWSISSINRFKAKTSFLAVFPFDVFIAGFAFPPGEPRRPSFSLSILSV
jgi:hypothetical protein